MPKLTRGAGPISREDGHWQSREDHETWVREVYAKHYPGEEPRACDCGFWADDWLTLCDPASRDQSCKRDVESRLADHHRRKHEQALGEKRKFPSLGPSEKHHCAWCKQRIVHGRYYQRGMHDGRKDEPNCRWLHGLHTDLHVQRSYLLKRDGMGCKLCGEVVGSWSKSGATDPDRWRAWGPAWAKKYPAEVWVGPLCSTHWETGLEVDHAIALALAWEAFSEDIRRRWFFSPANLRLLCGVCHKAKTAEDRRLISQAYEMGPEWAKAEVLRRLHDARLIAIARPKGAP